MSSFAQSPALPASSTRSEQQNASRNNDRRRHRKQAPVDDAAPALAPSRTVELLGNGVGESQKKRNRNKNRGKNLAGSAADNERPNTLAAASLPVVDVNAPESPAKKHRGDIDSKPTGLKDVAKNDSTPAVPKEDDPVLTAYMTTEKFSSLNICAESKRAIAVVLKFNFMTHVQATCIAPIQEGKDCLAKSKTGTG